MGFKPLPELTEECQPHLSSYRLLADLFPQGVGPPHPSEGSKSHVKDERSIPLQGYVSCLWLDEHSRENLHGAQQLDEQVSAATEI